MATFGETESDALRKLADAIDAHTGHGESIDDPEAYLAERGIDATIGAEQPPWFDADDGR